MYRHFLKHCGAASFGLMLSRVSGIVKLGLIAALFGTGSSMDAFLVASVVPLAFTVIFSEAAYVATVRMLSRRRNEWSRESLCDSANREAGALAILWLAITSCFAILFSAAAPLIIRLTAPGFDAAQHAYAVSLVPYIVPCVLLVSVQHVFHGILHVQNRFALPAMRLFVTNISIAVAAMLLHRRLGIMSYAVGNLAGELICCIGCWLVARRGGFRWRLPNMPALRSMCEGLQIGAPALICIGVLQITTISDRAFASGLAPGSIAALGYATIILTTTVTLARTVVDVGFPSISALAHAGVEAGSELRRALVAAFTLLLAGGVPATFLLCTGRLPLVSFALQRGRFDAPAAEATAVALMFLAIGFVPHLLRHYLTRMAQSFGRGYLPLPANIVAAACSIGLNFLLVPRLGFAGIALSLTISAAIGVVIMFVGLAKQVPQWPTSALLGIACRTSLAALIMLAAYSTTLKLGMPAIWSWIIPLGMYGVGLLAVGINVSESDASTVGANGMKLSVFAK